MLLMYVGIYTLCLAFFWWLLIVAKIHAYKFKNFSLHIRNVTQIMIVLSTFLSILGYLIIFFGVSHTQTVELPENIIKQNYDSQIITY